MTTEKIKSLLLMNENKKITVTLLAKKECFKSNNVKNDQYFL